MKTLRFNTYGEPGDVLHLEDADIPEANAGHVRIKVHACGLNPADWTLCRGLFAGNLPRGIGLDVSGTVDSLGEGVTGVAIGDHVLGVPAYQDYPSAGAADQAVLSVWAPVPAGWTSSKRRRCRWRSKRPPGVSTSSASLPATRCSSTAPGR